MFAGGNPSGHQFRTFGADGKNTEAVSAEMHQRSQNAPRLPRTRLGRVALAVAVVALLVFFVLVS